MDKAHLARVADFVRERQGEEVSLGEVVRLAEVMTESLRSAFKATDAEIYGELGAMVHEIAAMKSELFTFPLNEMRGDRIPAAGRELDAIVEATETATNAIMTAAEAMMGADTSDPEAYQALVNDKAIEIFEACSFQDITGQRISKVVATLNHIDSRISGLVERLKLLHADDAPGEETAADRRRRELLLNGPAMKGEGVSQADIDALLG